MTTPQPPAGWYADPQDASQQRYWDGTAWSGHTAPAAEAASMSAPTGAAPEGAAVPSGAPAWQMPVDGGGMQMPPTKKPWFKRRWFLVTSAVIVVLIVLGAVFGTTGDASNAMEKAIQSDGQKQLQAQIVKTVPDATVTVDKVDCVKTSGTQEYSCLMNITVKAAGETEKFVQHAAGECDDNNHCLWHTDGVPTQDNS